MNVVWLGFGITLGIGIGWMIRAAVDPCIEVTPPISLDHASLQGRGR